MNRQPQSNQPGAAGFHRRTLLRAGMIGGAGVAAGFAVGRSAVADAGAEDAAAPGTPQQPARVRLRWLGVAGWQLTFDSHVVWFDPYLSRFDPKADGGALKVRGEVIERLIASGRISGPPEVILISHGHFDHIADVPYLLGRAEWARQVIHVLGTETHRNLLAAMRTGDVDRPVIQVSGGEQFSFGGGAYTIQVVRSLHSQGQNYGFDFAGTLTVPPAPPTTIHDLLEGGTLAYLITVPGRLSVLLFGGTNFVERELMGLRPDVVAVCMTFHNAIDRYLERLLTVLGGPRYVIPVHHDDMVTGFDDPGLQATVRANAVTELQDVVRSLRLRTEVIAPRHLADIDF